MFRSVKRRDNSKDPEGAATLRPFDIRRTPSLPPYSKTRIKSLGCLVPVLNPISALAETLKWQHPGGATGVWVKDYPRVRFFLSFLRNVLRLLHNRRKIRLASTRLYCPQDFIPLSVIKTIRLFIYALQFENKKNYMKQFWCRFTRLVVTASWTSCPRVYFQPLQWQRSCLYET